ncbi:MAG: hypothetical protein ABSE04_03755 [Candidatus Microgenomates bacterium]|jgi:hypothetical protein
MIKFDAGKASLLGLIIVTGVVSILLSKTLTSAFAHDNDHHSTPTPTPTPTQKPCDNHGYGNNWDDKDCHKSTPTPTPTPTPTHDPCDKKDYDHDEDHGDKDCQSPSPTPTITPTPTSTPCIPNEDHQCPTATPVPSESPIATPEATVTPVPTDNNSSGGNDGGDGLGCAVHDCSTHPTPPQGQVLGASTMAGTGSFDLTFYQAIMGIGGIFTFKGIKSFKKVRKVSSK